ncbi:MAG: hypothetical protein AAGA58_11620 [Verrucomicrobiota bacterium]
MRTLRFFSVLAALAAAGWLAFGKKPWIDGLQSLAEDDRARTIHYVLSGSWMSAWGILAIAIAVFFVARWLVRPVPDDFQKSPASIPRQYRLVFWVAAVLATSTGAWTNSQRLDHSLWGDEESTMRRLAVGQWSRDDDSDSLRFRQAPWIDTLWRYGTPNNHFVNTILARATHETFFEESDDPQAMYFSERILRYPAFLAGLAGIVLLGWFVAAWGFPRAGIIAMFILAVHPWFIRYGVECRGYAFSFAFAPLCWLLCLKAIRRARWPYWIGFAFSEFLLFWSYPGNLYLLIGVNLAALGMIATNKGARGPLFGRWLTANILAGSLALVAFAPCVVQLLEYLERNAPMANHDLLWLKDHLAYFTSGIPWQETGGANPRLFDLSDFPPAAAWPMVLFPCVFFLLGGLRALGGDSRARLMLVALIVPWLLFFWLSIRGENRVYHWYAVPFLPGFLALVAVGVESLTSVLERKRARDLGALVMLGFYVWWFSIATMPVRTALTNFSVVPLAESVRATREVLNPRLPLQIDENVVTIGFCMAARGYDPAAYFLKTDDVEKFIRILRAAGETERDVFLNFGLLGLARIDYPGLMEFAEDPDYFQPLPHTPIFGQTDFGTRYVLQWTGKLPDSAD